MLDRLADGARPYVAAISLWEMALLVERGRVALRQSFDAWIDVAAAPQTVTLLDITAAVVKELLHFPPSFPRDPADRLIVATARAHGLPVLTRDAAIRRSGLARLWRP